MDTEHLMSQVLVNAETHLQRCLLYTSDAADELLCVALGGRGILKKKNTQPTSRQQILTKTTATLT